MDVEIEISIEITSRQIETPRLRESSSTYECQHSDFREVELFEDLKDDFERKKVEEAARRSSGRQRAATKRHCDDVFKDLLKRKYKQLKQVSNNLLIYRRNR